MKANGSASGDNSAGDGNPMNDMAQAGKAIGSSVSSLVGGLFHKKKTATRRLDRHRNAVRYGYANAPPPKVPAIGTTSADPYAQFMQLAAFTTETATINTDGIPADRFDVPQIGRRMCETLEAGRR